VKHLQTLLAVQLFAIAAAVVGDAFLGGALVALGVGTFFLALAAMFVQMTTALLVGLRESDGHARAC